MSDQDQNTLLQFLSFQSPPFHLAGIPSSESFSGLGFPTGTHETVTPGSTTTPGDLNYLFQKGTPDNTSAVVKRLRTRLSVDNISMTQLHGSHKQSNKRHSDLLLSSYLQHDMQQTFPTLSSKQAKESKSSSCGDYEYIATTSEEAEQVPEEKFPVLNQRPDNLTARLAALVEQTSVEQTEEDQTNENDLLGRHPSGEKEIRFLTKSTTDSYTSSDIMIGDETWGVLAKSVRGTSHGESEARFLGLQTSEQIVDGMAALEKKRKLDTSMWVGEQSRSLAIPRFIVSHMDKPSILLKPRIFSFAEAIATDDQERARNLFELLQQKEKVGPTGNPLQRTAYYAMEALRARTAGRGSSLWKASAQVSRSVCHSAKYNP